MNAKRVAIATILGVACGVFCAYGAVWKYPGRFGILVLASIIYNRGLMGFIIGIAENIRAHPILRGLVLGAIISIAIGIPSGLSGLSTLVAFGIVYGIIIDTIATKLS